MSIEELNRFLYDMYQMDICMPPFFGMWKDEFENLSYSVWAVNEVENHIAQRIYPRTYGSIDEFCELTKEFISKTKRYTKINPETKHIFQIANDMAINILDLLEAMR